MMMLARGRLCGTPAVIDQAEKITGAGLREVGRGAGDAEGREAEPRPSRPARARVKSLARDPAFRGAVFAFALTRALVFLLFLLTARLEMLPPASPEDQSFHAELKLGRVAYARIMRERVSVADSNWYMGIADGGYERRAFSPDRAANWAFFPLYPLTLRAASRLTGERPLTGAALSNLFFFFALLLLYKTAVAFGYTDSDARRTVFYIAAFPVSYFFSVPLTESLFLLLTVGSFYAARRERWLVAGLLGALASATRFQGVLLLPALAVLYWETYRTFRPRLNFLPLLLVPAGLLGYMAFLRSITGNPLAFKDVMAAWGREPGFFLKPLWHYLSDPLTLATSWDFRLINFLGAATVIACGLWLLRRRRWSLAAYALSSTFVALSSGILQSQARYAMVAFPAFMALSVAGRNARFDQAWRTASLLLLALMTLLYCYRVDIALS